MTDLSRIKPSHTVRKAFTLKRCVGLPRRWKRFSRQKLKLPFHWKRTCSIFDCAVLIDITLRAALAVRIARPSDRRALIANYRLDPHLWRCGNKACSTDDAMDLANSGSLTARASVTPPNKIAKEAKADSESSGLSSDFGPLATTTAISRNSASKARRDEAPERTTSSVSDGRTQLADNSHVRRSCK